MGSCWVNVLNGSTCDQTSSVTRPSITGGRMPSAIRTAGIVGGSAADARPHPIDQQMKTRWTSRVPEETRIRELTRDYGTARGSTTAMRGSGQPLPFDIAARKSAFDLVLPIFDSSSSI